MKRFIVICEGKSEEAYLNELNRVFRDKEVPLVFFPKIAISGHYKDLIKKYKEEYKINKNTDILILADKDIYIRNERNNKYQYEQKQSNIPNFLFHINNFEDFLVLHLEEDVLTNWISICESYNHFDMPLSSNKYIPLYTKHIFSSYTKGLFPFQKFNIETIKNAINNNNKNLKIKSDFLILLDKIFSKYL